MKMSMPCRMLIAALTLAASQAGHAQNTPPGSPPNPSSPPAIAGATPLNVDPMESAKYLGTSYKKESDGFRLTPPAGARLINRQGIDLVSFVVDAKSWGGSLQRIVIDTTASTKSGQPAAAAAKPFTLDDYVNTTKAEVSKDAKSGGVFKGVQVLEDKRVKKGVYDAAQLAFSMQLEMGPTISPVTARNMGLPVPTAGQVGQTISIFRQQLIVKIKDGLFNVLTFYTPLADREVATKTWEMMVTELEIYDSATIVKRRVEAAKAAKEWLAVRSAEELRGKILTQPQYFRMVVGNQDVGYIRFDELSQEAKGGTLVDVERDKHKGVLILINFRSFPDNNTVIYGQNEAFWSYSKDTKGEVLPAFSTWNNLSKTKAKVTVAPPPGQPGGPTTQILTPWLQEAGVLAQNGLPGPKSPYQLVVTLAGDTGQRLPNGPNLMIPLDAAAPLPKALEYTWTRLVDLTRASEMTFTVFDSNARKIGTRNLIVTGTKENVTIDGRVESCFKCVDESDPNSTIIWTDSAGKVRLMKTNDQSIMVPTTEAAMQTKWARRLADQ